MRYVVIGGAGSMGRITVKDLVETCKKSDEIIIADYDLAKAAALATALNDARVKAVHVNVKDRTNAAKAILSATPGSQPPIVLNSVQYQLNLNVMEAALEARAHYVDLGGLFHVTRQQLEFDDRFKRIGRTAVLGMGAAPGITNLLATLASDGLDEVTEIHTRVASMDKTRYEPKPALAVSYSLKTILEEFSYKPAVFTKGDFKFVEPMSGDQPMRFPPPIGVRRPMYTIHSEVATLPLSFKEKGVREVSFKIAFDPEFLDRVKFLRDLGLASHEPIEVPGGKVAPVDVANHVAMSQPVAKQVGKLKQYEVVRAIVKGRIGKKKVTVIADCHTAGMPEWGIGLDIDTGSPPAVAAQMIADREIIKTGALPPEVAVPADLFFNRLKQRKMKVKIARLGGWALKT